MAFVALLATFALGGCTNSPSPQAGGPGPVSQAVSQEATPAVKAVPSSGLTEQDVRAHAGRVETIEKEMGVGAVPGGPTASEYLQALVGRVTTAGYRKKAPAHLPGANESSQDERDWIAVNTLQNVAYGVGAYEWELRTGNTIVFPPTAAEIAGGGVPRNVAFKKVDGTWLVDDIWLDGQ